MSEGSDALAAALPGGRLEWLAPDGPLAQLCRRHGVRRLDVFGSATQPERFDPARSDIDLLVDYAPEAAPSAFDFLALREELAALFGRPVDLAMASAIRNPYLRRSIDAARTPLFVA
ncbi:nucleotidyltransferase family protein [Rubritepida flocculans]|jgi:predicted nucleotidyltransferase|uniref:nucleotidyltransferase family protein n=1 Tax=Rubritepida flocculans TaxID=182403 RepID=UPI0004285042|nr:nucleotidyltransferase domain-containing protein [Rubritepida flocculans]